MMIQDLLDRSLAVWQAASWSQLLGTWAIVATLNCLLQIYVLRPLRSKLYHHPPFYAEFPYLPFLGSLFQFAVQPRELLQRAAASRGPVFTLHLLGRDMTFLMDSDGHAHFFRAPEHVFDIRKAYQMTVTTFGPGVCYDVPQRRMAEQFAFFKNGLSDAAFVRHMENVQDEVANYFDTAWGDAGTANLLDALSNVFTLTSSRCLLGSEIRSRWKDSGMAEHYLALDHSFVPILFFFPWMPNPHRSRCIRARRLFERIFTEVMEERTVRARNDASYEPPRDFLQDLMEATYADGTKPTPTEITGILIGVLLGGQHTSNVTGTWILVHLLKNRIWYDKVMTEQEAIFAQKKSGDDRSLLAPSTLSFSDIQQDMAVFEQVFMEVLRLHHPFFQLSRSVLEDSVFRAKDGKTIVIPSGHFVNVAPSAAMRTAELFPDGPEDFDPGRFSAARAKQIKPHGFIGFGGGLHQCGGRKFAWNSLKASLTWLLRNYEMELVGAGATGMPKEDYTTMVVAPTSAHVQVRYKRRHRPLQPKQ